MRADPPTTYCRFHCRACARHFTSLAAFDAHRTGSHKANTRHCRPPERLTGAYLMMFTIGTCRLADGYYHPTTGVQVWAMARSYDEADMVQVWAHTPANETESLF